MDKRYLLAIFYYNNNFLELLDNLFDDIVKARINKEKMSIYFEKVEKVLYNKKIQVIKPRVDLKMLSKVVVYGMIRNLILREIRANYISSLVLKRWRIYNPGQHSCKRWLKRREEIIESMSAISKVINEEFIPSDVRAEFILRAPSCV